MISRRSVSPSLDFVRRDSSSLTKISLNKFTLWRSCSFMISYNWSVWETNERERGVWKIEKSVKILHQSGPQCWNENFNLIRTRRHIFSHMANADMSTSGGRTTTTLISHRTAAKVAHIYFFRGQTTTKYFPIILFIFRVGAKEKSQQFRHIFHWLVVVDIATLIFHNHRRWRPATIVALDSSKEIRKSEKIAFISSNFLLLASLTKDTKVVCIGWKVNS